MKLEVIKDYFLRELGEYKGVVIKNLDVNGLRINGKEDIHIGSYHFKILPVWYDQKKTMPTGHYVIFDVNNIELNSKIKIKVNAKIQGLVIGRKFWQVRFWQKKLGLKKIVVQ